MQCPWDTFIVCKYYIMCLTTAYTDHMYVINYVINNYVINTMCDGYMCCMVFECFVVLLC